MAFIACLFLFVIASLLVLFNWRRTGVVLYATSIIFFLALACGPIPLWLLDKLQSPYASKPVIEWGARNVIVLLGAGTEKVPHAGQVEPRIFSHSRLIETIGLYTECRKTEADCKIIISGGDAFKNGAPEALIYQDELVRAGVDPANVIAEADSMNTWQNAQFSSAILQKYNADNILLVSSGLHLQRSMLYFAHFGVKVSPIRSDYLGALPSLLPSSFNLAAADFAIHEYIGILRYYLYNAFGKNPARVLPGEA